MNNKIKYSKKTAHKFSLWALFLCCILLLTSCSGIFENNPILANMEKGQGIDLSLKNLKDAGEGVAELPAKEEGKETDTDYAAEFAANFDKLKAGITYKYTRKIKFVGTPPAGTTESQKFLQTETLAAAEYKGEALFVDPSNANTLNIKEGKGFIKNFDAQNAVPTELSSYDTRSLLYYLTNDITVKYISTEEEVVDGKNYIAFLVDENGHSAKWYFDDNGFIAIRLFLDEDVLCAVYYSDIKLNVELDKKYFAVEEDLEGLAIEDDNSIASPDQNLPDSTENAITTPEETDKTESTTTKPPATTTPGGTVSSEQTSKPAENSTPAKQPDNTTTSGSTGQSGSQGSGSQSSVVPVVPEGPSVIKENPNAPVENSKPATVIKEPLPAGSIDPKTLTNYPRDLFPLIYGYTIYSAEDGTVGDKRVIELRGSLTGSIESTAEYYEELMALAVNFKSKQVYDDKTGATYYIISGRISMWTAMIEIAEDHITFNRTMTIHLEAY